MLFPDEKNILIPIYSMLEQVFNQRRENKKLIKWSMSFGNSEGDIF